ncbi:syntaxin-18 [Ciona intestinalis]
MIDRTPEFLKLLKQIRKNEGISAKSILTSQKKILKSSFEIKSRGIVTNLTQLRDFLLDNRHGYVGRDETLMTNQEKDKIDADGEKFMKICSRSLEQLKQDTPTNQTTQVGFHQKLVVEIVEKYLKLVFQIYNEQKSVRVKQIIERNTVSQLHSDSTRTKTSGRFSDHVNHNPKYLFEESDDDGLVPDDDETLAQENEQLLSDMNSLSDEVRSIGGKVVEIAKLHEMFSEQVFQQEADIELVSEKIVESSENVKDGNEELREAIKNNAGFRVWVLFFLVMCSFSLLFLEWYS